MLVKACILATHPYPIVAGHAEAWTLVLCVFCCNSLRISVNASCEQIVRYVY